MTPNLIAFVTSSGEKCELWRLARPEGRVARLEAVGEDLREDRTQGEVVREDVSGLSDLAAPLLEPKRLESSSVDHAVELESERHTAETDRDSSIEHRHQFRRCRPGEESTHPIERARSRLSDPCETILVETVFGRIIDISLNDRAGCVSVLGVEDAPETCPRRALTGCDFILGRRIRVV